MGELASNETIDAAAVYVFPNPSSDRVWIKSTGTKVSQVSILDMTGRSILVQDTNDSLVEIDVNALPAGQYIIEAQHGTGINRNLFIKR